jgi:hypothetical protein
MSAIFIPAEFNIPAVLKDLFLVSILDLEVRLGPIIAGNPEFFI